MYSLTGTSGDTAGLTTSLAVRDRRFLTGLGEQAQYDPENVVVPPEIVEQVSALASIQPYNTDSGLSGARALKDNLDTTRLFIIHTNESLLSLQKQIDAAGTTTTDSTVTEDMKTEYNKQILKKTIALVIDQNKRGIDAIQSSIDWLNGGMKAIIDKAIAKLRDKIVDLYNSDDLKAGDGGGDYGVDEMFSGAMSGAGAIAGSAGAGYSMAGIGAALAGALALVGGSVGLAALVSTVDSNNKAINDTTDSANLAQVKIWYASMLELQKTYGTQIRDVLEKYGYLYEQAALFDRFYTYMTKTKQLDYNTLTLAYFDTRLWFNDMYTRLQTLGYLGNSTDSSGNRLVDRFYSFFDETTTTSLFRAQFNNLLVSNSIVDTDGNPSLSLFFTNYLTAVNGSSSSSGGTTSSQLNAVELKIVTDMEAYLKTSDYTITQLLGTAKKAQSEMLDALTLKNMTFAGLMQLALNASVVPATQLTILSDIGTYMSTSTKTITQMLGTVKTVQTDVLDVLTAKSTTFTAMLNSIVNAQALTATQLKIIQDMGTYLATSAYTITQLLTTVKTVQTDVLDALTLKGVTFASTLQSDAYSVMKANSTLQNNFFRKPVATMYVRSDMAAAYVSAANAPAYIPFYGSTYASNLAKMTTSSGYSNLADLIVFQQVDGQSHYVTIQPSILKSCMQSVPQIAAFATQNLASDYNNFFSIRIKASLRTCVASAGTAPVYFALGAFQPTTGLPASMTDTTSKGWLGDPLFPFYFQSSRVQIEASGEGGGYNLNDNIVVVARRSSTVATTFYSVALQIKLYLDYK